MPDKKKEFQDEFLEGNERIEEAIDKYYENESMEAAIDVFETIRKRMHEDGHFLLPIMPKKEEEVGFLLCTLEARENEQWQVAFTSQSEFEKGPKSGVISNFIDETMRGCITADCPGIVINPWGRHFLLPKKQMEEIFAVDGGVEYAVPDVKITPELLEDGSFLTRVVGICSRNRTKLNVLKLLRILRDSEVWVPCNAIMGSKDQEAMEKMVKEAEENGDPDSLIGKTIQSQEEVRLVPDILESGGEYFFPVFSTAEEMGEYGERFSKVPSHFLRAVELARNNERNVEGIVINAFSEPFVVGKELFEMVEGMDSILEEQGIEEE